VPSNLRKISLRCCSLVQVSSTPFRGLRGVALTRNTPIQSIKSIHLSPLAEIFAVGCINVPSSAVGCVNVPSSAVACVLGLELG
jgi:hypothetical protein